jgi:hypothetical protein
MVWRLERLRPAANRAERLALHPRDLGRIAAAAALEVEVIADGIVEQSHCR